MFFSSWGSLLRVAVIGVLGYIALVLLLRISGKRTLSKMNAFDLVVTIALGSTYASILLSKNVALAEGVLAFAVLIGLQYAVAWCSLHSVRARRLIKAEPALLYFRGEFLREAVNAERVTDGELQAAVRSQGHATWDEVSAVVLETDGTFSVLDKSEERGFPAVLSGVRRPIETARACGKATPGRTLRAPTRRTPHRAREPRFRRADATRRPRGN